MGRADAATRKCIAWLRCLKSEKTLPAKIVQLFDSGSDEIKAGIVPYDGELAFPFGNRLFAAPVSCLWR